MSPIPLHVTEPSLHAIEVAPTSSKRRNTRLMETVSGIKDVADKADDESKSTILDPECLTSVTEEVADLDETSFSYRIFLPEVRFPPSYQSGWCPTALKFLLDSSDEGQCESVLCTYESHDWRKEAADGGHSLKYFHLIDDLFKILPAFDMRCQSENIERLITTAKAAYRSSARLFIMAYFTHLRIFMPNGFVARYGYIDYAFCPIQRFYLCYSIRILRYRYPFCCIPIQDIMLEKVEDCIFSLSLEQHKMEYEELGIRIPTAICKILAGSSL